MTKKYTAAEWDAVQLTLDESLADAGYWKAKARKVQAQRDELLEALRVLNLVLLSDAPEGGLSERNRVRALYIIRDAIATPLPKATEVKP